MKLRGVKVLTEGHMASKQVSWCLSYGLSYPMPVCFQSLLYHIFSSSKAEIGIRLKGPSSLNVIQFSINPGPPKPLNYHSEGNLKPVRHERIISIFLHV